MILDNPNTPNKYSKTYLNLKSVVELENKDGKKLTPQQEKLFQSIEKRYNNFVNGIPLIMIERSYARKRMSDSDQTYVNTFYNDCEDSRPITEVFSDLEQFFADVFKLACELANDYNIEVAINKQASEQNYA